MSSRAALTEAERRLRGVAKFLADHNPHQANALVSLADDLARSAPDSVNEQLALVLLGMDPYADPRPEYVALPTQAAIADPPADLRVLLSDSSGDLWDARGGTLRFSREEWAVVVEGLSALRRSIVDRWDPSEEVTRDMAAALLGRISGGAGRSIS